MNKTRRKLLYFHVVDFDGKSRTVKPETDEGGLLQKLAVSKHAGNFRGNTEFEQSTVKKGDPDYE